MDYYYYVHHCELQNKTDQEIIEYINKLDPKERMELFIYYIRSYK